MKESLFYFNKKCRETVSTKRRDTLFAKCTNKYEYIFPAKSLNGKVEPMVRLVYFYMLTFGIIVKYWGHFTNNL